MKEKERRDHANICWGGGCWRPRYGRFPTLGTSLHLLSHLPPTITSMGFRQLQVVYYTDHLLYCCSCRKYLSRLLKSNFSTINFWLELVLPSDLRDHLARNIHKLSIFKFRSLDCSIFHLKFKMKTHKLGYLVNLMLTYKYRFPSLHCIKDNNKNKSSS